MLALVILLRSLLEISAEDWRETFVYSRGKKKMYGSITLKKKWSLIFLKRLEPIWNVQFKLNGLCNKGVEKILRCYIIG